MSSLYHCGRVQAVACSEVMPDARHAWESCRGAGACAAGGGCLHLAIGKSAGSIAAWSSPRFSSLSALAGEAGCGALCSVRQGSSTAVGVAWAMPPTQAQDTAAVLTASMQDGSLSSWKWNGQQVLRPNQPLCPSNELSSPQLQPCSKCPTLG